MMLPMATTWQTVRGATWDDVSVGDRASISTREPDQEGLGIVGRVTRLTDEAAEFQDGMVIVPKADFRVDQVIRQR